MRGVKDAFLLWGRRRVTVPRGEIHDLLVSGRPSRGGVKGRARIEVKHEGRRWMVLPGPRTTVFTLNHPSLLERDALLQFAFSVGRAIGFAHYEIHRDDHLDLTVGLEEDPGAATEPVPGVRAGGGGEPEGRLTGRGVPERDLPPFDPALRGSSYEVLDYRPGDQVRIRKEGLTVTAALWTSVLGTALFNVPTLAAAWAIWGRGGVEVGIFWQGVVVAVFAFVTVLLNLYVWGAGRTTREADLDWARSVCHLRRNGREVRVPLSRIEDVEVRGYRLRTARQEGRYSYRCEVLLRTPDGLGEVLRTGSERIEDRVYRQAASLAEDLAEALGVPWRFGGWRDRTLWEEAKEMGRAFLALRKHAYRPRATSVAVRTHGRSRSVSSSRSAGTE